MDIILNLELFVNINVIHFSMSLILWVHASTYIERYMD